MKQLFGYGRPLVVLINGGSRSAKEVFSAIIKKSGRGKLIGQTTAGHVLGTFPQRIADWAYLEIPMVDVKVDGTRIEGSGVKPDIEVTPEYAPDGTDRVLQEALRQLTSTPSRNSAARFTRPSRPRERRSPRGILRPSPPSQPGRTFARPAARRCWSCRTRIMFKGSIPPGAGSKSSDRER